MDILAGGGWGEPQRRRRPRAAVDGSRGWCLQTPQGGITRLCPPRPHRNVAMVWVVEGSGRPEGKGPWAEHHPCMWDT